MIEELWLNRALNHRQDGQTILIKLWLPHTMLFLLLDSHSLFGGMDPFTTMEDMFNLPSHQRQFHNWGGIHSPHNYDSSPLLSIASDDSARTKVGARIRFSVKVELKLVAAYFMTTPPAPHVWLEVEVSQCYYLIPPGRSRIIIIIILFTPFSSGMEIWSVSIHSFIHGSSKYFRCK